MIHFSSESNEWFTPVKYIELVKEVIGIIDLDPASCLEANQKINANSIFTKETNALKREWKAETIFCNPPYGKGLYNQSQAGMFLNKMIVEYDKGNFNNGIILVNASTSENWFQSAFNYPICFTNHRIKFNLPNNKKANAPTKGNAFIYFGNNIRKFVKVFSEIGTTVMYIQCNLKS